MTQTSGAQDSSSGRLRKRYGTYTSGDREEIAVRIKAADYNGSEWDGCPFSTLPTWLRQAVQDGSVVPHTRNSTDYAEWDIVTATTVVSATAGDWIVRRERGDLSVVPEQDAFILINLRAPVEGNTDRE